MVSTRTSQRRSSSVLLTFGLVLGLLAMGYGALFSMLDDIRDTYGVGEAKLGAVIGIGFFAGFLSQVLIAPLADRGHARALVLAGICVNVAGLVALAASRSFLPLVCGRFVMGVGVGMAVPAVRRIVILADPDRIGHNLGRLLAADVAGFAAGPAVAAIFVGHFGIPVPFLIIAAANVVALPFVVRSSGRIAAADDTPEATQRLAFDLLRIRPYLGALLMGCAVWVMIGSFDALWSVALDDLQTADWIANLGITLFAVPLVIFGAAGGRLSQRAGPFRVGAIGLVLGALFMLLYGLVASGVAMFAVAMVHAVSDGLTISSTGVAAGMVVPPERQAGAQGLLGGIQTLLAGATASLAGAVYELGGRTAAYAVAATLMLVLVGTGFTIAGPARRMRGIPREAGYEVLAADPVVP
jgi:MFS family permease